MWFILDGARYLEYLDLSNCCNLETLPDNIQNNSMLVTLNLDECRKLKSLPKLPASLQQSLQQLTAMNCTYLDTNSIQRPMLENMLHRLRINYGHRSNNLGDLSFLPGSQVPCEFDFHTTEASIVIPPMSKSGLCCFVFCIILSEGININYGDIFCTIYEHNKHVDECDVFYARGRLISDHVLLSCWYDIYKLVEVGSARGGDHYNLHLNSNSDIMLMIRYNGQLRG